MKTRNASETEKLKALLNKQSIDMTEVMELIRLGADPDTTDDNGSALLHMLVAPKNSSFSHFMRAVDELVNNHQANINIKDVNGQTPLVCALSGYHQSDIVLKLIQLGAQDDNGHPFNLPESCLLDSKKLIANKSIYTGWQSIFGDNLKVYVGDWDKQEVAIKTARYYHPELRHLRFILNEIKFMLKLTEVNASNVIKFIGYTINSPDYSIVMEYANNGSLNDFIKNNPSSSLFWGERYEFIKGMLNGLNFIHQCQIIHGDLTSRNVFVDKNKQAKIGDFDSSINMNEVPPGHRCTATYRSPEAHKDLNYSVKSDVFSLAIIMWELAEWQLVMDFFIRMKEGSENAISNYYNSGRRPNVSNKTPPKIASLITWGLKHDPKLRPTPTELQTEMNSDIHTLSDNLHKFVL